MDILLIVLYVFFAVGGSTLIKWGGIAKTSAHLVVPIINITVSLISLLGILFYGLSFLLYIILLNKFELSFISPITIGIVYILLMITAYLIFGEQFTLIKIIGCLLILIGVLMIATTASVK